jgi:hypothetical protein
MKNQLIPQKRMNKNGVLVTKHVRDDSAPSRIAMSLPAPYGAMQSERKMKVEFLTKALHSSYEEYDEQEYDTQRYMTESVLAERIDGLDNDVLSAYYEDIRDHVGVGYEDILLSAMHNNIRSDKAGSVLFIARLEGELDLEWSSYRSGVFSYVQARRLHSGLSYYEPDVSFPSNLLLASEEEQAKAATLINAVLGYLEVGEDEDTLLDYHDKYDGGMLAFENTDLADLFLDHPEQTKEIVHLMQDRGASDADSLRVVIEAEVTAVRDGIL